MNARRIICTGAVLVTMVFPIGCATSPSQNRNEAATALMEMRDGLNGTRVHIDETLLSLNSLLTAPPSKLKENYKDFSKKVDTMTKESEQVRKQAEQMRENSAAWVAKWGAGQSDISNPELRRLSEDRRAVVMSRIQDTNSAYQTASSSLDPFVANLRDIKQVIGTDLTPKGIEALSATEVVKNANANGAAAARSIDTATLAFQPLVDALTPSTK